jgi:hypothetical protein
VVIDELKRRSGPEVAWAEPRWSRCRATRRGASPKRRAPQATIVGWTLRTPPQTAKRGKSWINPICCPNERAFRHRGHGGGRFRSTAAHPKIRPSQIGSQRHTDGRSWQAHPNMLARHSQHRLTVSRQVAASASIPYSARAIGPAQTACCNFSGRVAPPPRGRDTTQGGKLP